MAKCMLCGKMPHSVNNVPNSMHKTKRMVQPNIQKIEGVRMCARCIRTLKNKSIITTSVAA